MLPLWKPATVCRHFTSSFWSISSSTHHLKDVNSRTHFTHNTNSMVGRQRSNKWSNISCLENYLTNSNILFLHQIDAAVPAAPRPDSSTQRGSHERSRPMLTRLPVATGARGPASSTRVGGQRAALHAAALSIEDASVLAYYCSAPTTATR
jgi:hypothetical protein